MIAALWGGGTPMVDVAQTIPHIFLDFMQMREFARDPLVFVAQEALLGVAA